MNSKYRQAVADAWTDMANWLNTIFPQELQGQMLQNYNGSQSDNQVDICNPGKSGWYPNGNYNWSTRNIGFASLTGAVAQPGIVSTANSTDVIGQIQFAILNISGTYQGSQKCMVAPPNVSPTYPTESCSCSFTYTASSGVINYTLSTSNNTITVTTVTLTNASGGMINPSVIATNVTGPVSASTMAGYVQSELPNLFSTSVMTSLLITTLSNYIQS